MSLAVAAPAAAQLETAVMDPKYFGKSTRAGDFDRAKRTGAGYVRLILTWRSAIHRSGGAEVRPVDPTNPNDVAYNWDWFDKQVQAADDRDLEIIATIVDAPDFAHRSTGTPSVKPRPAELADFAQAAAARYPDIKYWQVWNEPNRDYFLKPQIWKGIVVSARHYRKLVNAVADRMRALYPENRIIAGGLAPLGRRNKPAPIRFMKELFKWTVKFDIWSHHPYTSGGPTHRARGSGNVALGNLPKMRKFLRSRADNIDTVTGGRPKFWVTEFSWDTKGPDPRGVPMNIHARWTSEALYRMWRQGIRLVTWFKVRDDSMARPPKGSHYQSGLYKRNRAPKKSLRAFKFPFVAFRRPHGRIYVWGRTPTSDTMSGRVVLQIRVNRRWRNLAGVKANTNGIFKRTVRTRYRNAAVRARFAGKTSVPFSLRPVRDRWVNPFGCGGHIRC